MGGTGMGTARYDARKKTWILRSTVYSPFGKSTGRGTIRFRDENTMEWTWREYAFGGLMKTMEFEGLGRRVEGGGH